DQERGPGEPAVPVVAGADGEPRDEARRALEELLQVEAPQDRQRARRACDLAGLPPSVHEARDVLERVATRGDALQEQPPQGLLLDHRPRYSSSSRTRVRAGADSGARLKSAWSRRFGSAKTLSWGAISGHSSSMRPPGAARPGSPPSRLRTAPAA